MKDKLAKFSACSATAAVYVAEEVHHLSEEDASSLKKAVTGAMNTAEEKGVAKVFVANRCNIICNANRNPFPGEKSDRRLALFPTADSTQVLGGRYLELQRQMKSHMAARVSQFDTMDVRLLSDFARWVVDNHATGEGIYLQDLIPDSDMKDEGLLDSSGSRSHGVIPALRPLLADGEQIAYVPESFGMVKDDFGRKREPSAEDFGRYPWPRATAESPCFFEPRKGFAEAMGEARVKGVRTKELIKMFLHDLMAMVNRDAEARRNKTRFNRLWDFTRMHFNRSFGDGVWKFAREYQVIPTMEFALLTLLRTENPHKADANYLRIISGLREDGIKCGDVPLDALKAWDDEVSHYVSTGETLVDKDAFTKPAPAPAGAAPEESWEERERRGAEEDALNGDEPDEPEFDEEPPEPGARG